MSAKEIVKSFYESNLANGIELVPKYFHKECQLHWNSSTGYNVKDYDDIIQFFKHINTAYDCVRVQISHLLEDGNHVTVRYTLFVNTIEDPENEQALANFISIWELKDDKLYRGYEISQIADDNLESYKSFSEIKV
ncbi:nuclear transport factor 2 family protein [Gelidibacter salicanalis]|uniref:Nuclear transport factor 2 family protein n=1 Tax=Gelidibacter salicanalis TaxID=291193 RepID=A0A934KXF6_9FLAO|nr:nuclear transport factor 2 family protein [Gelidibacter salicanalis]MBJ7882663.1 nuclear transport factor 2 family protein [Gelidibacter salicanalis]